MVVVEYNERLWRIRSVFFPDREQVGRALNELRSNEILHIHQTSHQIEPLSQKAVHYEPFPTTRLDLNKALSDLYREMDPKSCRYELRKAEKLKDSIQIRKNDETAFRDFLKIYNRFVALKGHARPVSQKRLRAICRVADVFVAYFAGEPICAHSIVRDKSVKRARLFLSGSARLENEVAARRSGFLNRYLHWHEIQLYKTLGMNTYDFGGAGGADGVEAITHFKRSFGGAEVLEHSYTFAGPLGRLRLSAGHLLRFARTQFPGTLHENDMRRSL